MMRVKLPYGGITADQMDAMAEVSETYSGLHRGHITTRENFQFHFVNLVDAAKVMRILGAAGLTTREACAHTVRNITACPDAGVSPDETFDTTPWLVAYARNMLRNPICQRLPRKFKTSFSNSGADYAGSNFHDLGFIARERTGANGQKEYGFQLRVGGGTQRCRAWPTRSGSSPGSRTASTSASPRRSCASSTARATCRACCARTSTRRASSSCCTRSARRLSSRRSRKSWRRTGPRSRMDMATLTQMAPEEPEPPVADDGKPAADGFERWRRTNVAAQKQDGFFMATITIPMGNICTDQFRELARIMRKYTGGHARTNQNQNMVLRWVRPESLRMLHAELAGCGFGFRRRRHGGRRGCLPRRRQLQARDHVFEPGRLQHAREDDGVRLR